MTPFEWDVRVSSKASRGDRFYFAVDTPTGVNVLRDSYTTLPDATVYVPAGLLGHAYWYAVLPFHAVAFPFMSRNILRAAEDNADDQR